MKREPEEMVTSSVRRGLCIVRFGRRHGNALNDELLRRLTGAFRAAQGDASVRGVLLAARGKLFSPGLDLLELADLDRPAMEAFMGRFRETMEVMYTFPKPLVAALSGHALAGGCLLALTADWRILCRGAKMGLNEIRVGVPLPFGAALILRESVRTARVEEVALMGRNYRNEEAMEAGLAHEVRDADGFEEHCLDRLAVFASRNPSAFAVTKRYLRSATVERIRARDEELLGEFLDCWFSPVAQERIGAVVAGLSGGTAGGRSGTDES